MNVHLVRIFWKQLLLMSGPKSQKNLVRVQCREEKYKLKQARLKLFSLPSFYIILVSQTPAILLVQSE